MKSDKRINATVAVSNRHVHLTEEVYNKLFEEGLTIKKPLMQVGEFASNETVMLKTEKGVIENVRIVGPLRHYNQVEIARSDARKLGLNPPVRKSGDLKGSETITIVGPKGEVALNEACIIAERHVHMNDVKAQELGLKDEDLVKVRVNNDKGGMMDAFVKVSENGFFEIHIDVDDANAFMLESNDEVQIEW